MTPAVAPRISGWPSLRVPSQVSINVARLPDTEVCNRPKVADVLKPAGSHTPNQLLVKIP
jgi:hypothetical protein